MLVVTGLGQAAATGRGVQETQHQQQQRRKRKVSLYKSLSMEQHKKRDLYRKHHSPSLLGKQNRTKKVIPFTEQRAEPGVLKPSNAEGPFLKTNEALKRPEFIIALSQFSPG